MPQRLAVGPDGQQAEGLPSFPQPRVALASRLALVVLQEVALGDYAGELQAARQIIGDFRAALDVSRLEEIDLSDTVLWSQGGYWKGAAVLGAMRGHPALRTVRLDRNDVGSGDSAVAVAATAAARDAIAGLIAADSSALRVLSFSGCGLDASALGSVFDALAQNTHLERLECRQLRGAEEEQSGNDGEERELVLDESFVITRVLPAVRACTTLRELLWDDSCVPAAAAAAVAAVLSGRRGGGAPAAQPQQL